MKKTVFAAALGLLIGFSVAPFHQLQGQPGGVPAIAAHHQELAFGIAPYASQVFAIPVVDKPVRIEVSFSLANGGTQTPSEIMYAVVNQDSSSTRFTWVGTNNDGSQQAGTSIPPTTGETIPAIARICGGNCLVTNAALEVDSDATVPGTLKLSMGNAVSPGNFKVSLWY